MLSKVRSAWEQASSELSVEVDMSGRQKFGDQLDHIVAFLPHFGGPHGMIVDLTASDYDFNSKTIDFAKKHNMYYSFIGPGYSEYNRAEIIDTLMDWGYFGPVDLRPKWFPGDTPFG